MFQRKKNKSNKKKYIMINDGIKKLYRGDNNRYTVNLNLKANIINKMDSKI